MVLSKSFVYKFPITEKSRWIDRLNQGFRGYKNPAEGPMGKITTKQVMVELIVSVSQTVPFGDNNYFEFFLSMDLVKEMSEVEVCFENVWDQHIFWNYLPTINSWIPLDLSFADPKAVATIIECACAEIDYDENRIELETTIPFSQIKEIMVAVHQKCPIKCLYYSPQTQAVHVMFQSGNMLLISPTGITNRIGFVFDYLTGFSSDTLGNSNWTKEMVSDFRKWQQQATEQIFYLY